MLGSNSPWCKLISCVPTLQNAMISCQNSSNGLKPHYKGGPHGEIQKLAFAKVTSESDGSISNNMSYCAGFSGKEASIVRPSCQP
jgi:hypothetical protein